MVLAGDRRLGLRPGALDEPMDTIFVKHVKPGSPAEQAGLQKGDRVVSVNGETVSGYSYAAVVHRIHSSGPCLHLLVVPQQDDILQLYFNETAHRPESNLKAIEPMVRAGGVRPVQWEAAGRRISDGATDSSESITQYPANTAGCRLSLDSGLIGRHDSLSHEGSASSLGDHSSDDSVIISRIRKSFEQKEEFLKRPAAPVWPSNTTHPQGVKEFYARPQKLQPPPQWPPNIPQSPNHSPSRREKEDTPPRERGFVCGGPVTNAPCDRRSRPGFVTNLGRIHETSLSNPPPLQIQVVSQRARQFESGVVPDRTVLYRSELARLSNKRMVPDVTVRAREYESKSDRRARESRSLDSAGVMPVSGGLSGNRLVPVGNRNIHCEPPTVSQPLSYDGSGTEDSSSTPQDSPGVAWRDKTLNETGSEEDRATRRVSYIKATWPDHMNVDSDADISDTEPPVSVVEPRHSLCEELSLPDKENIHITLEGSLNCKVTLVEGKRAADRSWKQVWAVLRTPILYFYKERRDSLPLAETPVGEPGVVEQVDVRSVQQVAPAEDYIKRKHVLRLQTVTGTELLLQATDDVQMARWIDTLKEQANNNNTQSASVTNLSPPSAQKTLRKLTSLRNRSPTGQSPVNKTRKPSQQVEPAVSPKSKTWKGRVAKQFRRIQHSGSPVSPTAPASHQHTYPEGATIGVPLEDCPPSTSNEFVPLIVELFTGIVEEKGLDVIGIYRVPGNTAAVSSLTEAANRGLDMALLDQDQRWRDVNVISSLLKSFFRRLPDSLLTTELYPSFIQADKIQDPHLRMATIRKLIHDLPDHHYETLKYLLLHLKKVVEHSAMNKMEARNLAIVFGPTLVRAADDNMVTMVTDMSHQCRIVETLILHVDWCFSDETVDRLSLEEVEAGAEADPAVANHNLLLSNIHKVEAIVKKIAETGRAAKPLAIVSPSSTSGRGRLHDEGGGGVPLRRGSSAENINQAQPEKQANGNLKRFKSGKEQGEVGLGRCGSLDSLHDSTTTPERPSSHMSEEGGDLLVSLLSTFDSKLPSRQSTGTSDNPPSSSTHTQFSDPSLHRSCDKEGKEQESKEECCIEKENTDSTNLLTKAEEGKELEKLETSEPHNVRLYRSESVSKDERASVFRSESLSKSDSFKLRRSESLNKEGRSESKLKRSDSLTKNEKTESNLNKRRQLEAGRWNNMVKLKRKTGSALDRSIKRRHTVGGTKDFDKVHWLDNRQREAEEEGKKERRTSSPDLSCSRLSAIVRPHSFAEPNFSAVPLESHV